MDLRLTLEPDDRLVVHLRDGDDHAAVSVRPARAGAISLARAIGDAVAGGYGECFWPAEPIGQTWWIFKRDADTLETVAMWTRGGVTGWEHVFRATDASAWVRARFESEIDRLSLRTG